MKKRGCNKIPASVIIAITILSLIVIFVSINTPTVDNLIVKTLSEVETLEHGMPNLQQDFYTVRRSYEKRSGYINLTVSHSLMADVDAYFADLEGAVLAQDKDGFTKAKSRLIDALRHVRRLSGFKLESII